MLTRHTVTVREYDDGELTRETITVTESEPALDELPAPPALSWADPATWWPGLR
jgi:hypothetical protein